LLEGFGVVWPTLGELCAPILPIVEPADGGDELCSLAPPEVSALPDGGMVADLDASGDVVFAVGGLVGVSAAKTGAIPMESAKAANARRRVMSSSFLGPNRIARKPNASKLIRFHRTRFCVQSSKTEPRKFADVSPLQIRNNIGALAWLKQ
jgi:hypothetical protein